MAVRVRTLLLPVMATILLGYVAAHSPLLVLIGQAVGHRAATCYFTCSGWVPNGRPLDAAAGVLCVLLAGWAALLLAPRLVSSRSECLVAFGLLAVTFVVVPASWLGLVGWAVDGRWLHPPHGPLLTAIPSLAVVAVAWRRSWALLPRLDLPAAPPRLVGALAVTAFALLVLAAAVSLSRPPTGYDALSYHGPLAVYYWRDGNLGGYLERQPWAWALAHPGTAELWFGLLRLAAGERVASLGQLPFALVGAASVHALGRRSGLPVWPASLGGLAFLIAPMVVVQSGLQLNDLAAGALVLAGLALTASRPGTWSPPRLGLIGLALGLAITTKLAVLPAAVGIIGYLAFRLRGATHRAALVGWSAGAFLLVAAPWWLRNAALFGNPIFPAALPILGRGFVVGDFARKDNWFVPGAWAWPFYPVIEPHDEMSGFGALFAMAALPGVLVALARARRAPVALVTLVAFVSLVAWWRLTQHEPRLLLGVIGAGFAGIGWALLALPRAQRRAGACLLAGAAVFSAAVSVDRVLVSRLATPSSRALFYEEEWGIDSTVAALPEREGLFYHTGYAYRSYAGDYPLLGPRQDRLLTVIDGVFPTDSIVRLMRAQDSRYAYVPVARGAVDTVLAMYSPDRFEVEHRSTITRGRWNETTRYLFRLREGME